MEMTGGVCVCVCVYDSTKSSIVFSMPEMCWKQEILHDGIKKQLIVSPSVINVVRQSELIPCA